MYLADEFLVTERTEISGRGVVIPVEDLVEGNLGQALRVEIRRPDGSALAADASIEFILQRSGVPREIRAFLVKVTASEIPPGSRIRVVGDAPARGGAE